MIQPEALAGVLDAMLEGLQVLGSDWRYVHVNEAAARHGRTSRAALLGRSLFACYPGIERTPVFAAMTRCMHERVDCTMDSDFPFPDGSIGHFEVRIHPVPQGICVLSIDVTERKRAEAAQRRAEQQLADARRLESIGMLAAGVAHDFNNYLTLILDTAQRAASRAAGPANVELERIVEHARSAAELTRELLSLGGCAVLHKEAIDLAALVHAAGPELRMRLGDHIELRLPAASTSPPVHADRQKVQRILFALLENAREAIVGRGEVTIAVAATELGATPAAPGAAVPADPAAALPAGRYTTLSITDTGCGMDEATRARSFEPFFTTKDAGRRAGLGLSTVLGLVKQHAGHVDVRTAPGCGTTIAVHLPCAITPAEVSPGRQRPAPAAELPVILVVDDTAEVAQLIARQLGSVPCRVLVATSGEEALSTWRDQAQDIDLLLTDMMMPGVPGPELIAAVRAVRPDLPVLCMSGFWGARGDVPADVQYLEKPFTAAQLRAKVQTMLACQTR